VGAIYISVLSGLSAVVQFHAPSAYRGRVLSFYLVALGVAYPVGSLLQGPIVDRIGIGWTTTGTALLLWLVLGVAAATLPAARRALLLPAPVERLPALPRPRPSEPPANEAHRREPRQRFLLLSDRRVMDVPLPTPRRRCPCVPSSWAGWRPGLRVAGSRAAAGPEGGGS
ncbi:MAG: hypothetical protein ACRDPO_37885, partial [Streptosporangiaceae bacterium]